MRSILSMIKILIILFCILLFAREVKEYIFTPDPTITANSQNNPSKDQTKKRTAKNRKKQQAQKKEYLQSYHYQQLSDSEKEKYDTFYSAIISFEDSFSLEDTCLDEIKKIFDAVLYDHPEIFWCSRSAFTYSYHSLQSEEDYHGSFKISPTYLYQKKEARSIQLTIDQAAEKILGGISENEYTYTKIKYIYDYLITNVSYDTDALKHSKDLNYDQNIDSVFIDHKTVCAGYSKAFQYLAQKLQINCIYVTGDAITAASSNPHAWNIVQCDGEYYYVDTTWGNPLYDETATSASPQLIGPSYDYFMCSDAILSGSHHLDNTNFSYPSCNKTDYYYYYLNGNYFTSCDINLIQSKIISDVEEKRERTILKFSDDKIFRELSESQLNDMIQQGFDRMRYLYNSTGSCQKISIPDSCKYILVWDYEK